MSRARGKTPPTPAAAPAVLGSTGVLLCLVLAFAALFAYAGAFSCRFVYDDDSFVVLNPAIRTLDNPARFFTDPRTLADDADLARDNYRPLTALSFALNYALSALEPGSYHVINVLLHAANGVLLFLLIFALAGRGRSPDPAAAPPSNERNLAFAFLAAAIFLLHPLQTESVTWVSQRSGLLSALFMLGAWHAYIRGKKIVGPVLFVCALLCKEEAVVLPVLLVIQDWLLPPLPLSLAPKGAREVKPQLKISAYIPHFAAVFALILAKRILVGQVAQTEYWGGGVFLTVLTTFKGWLTFLKLLFIPWPQSIEYVLATSTSLLEPASLAAVFVLGGLTAAAWWLRRRRPFVSFGILIFLIGLGPVSNIIPIRTIINERFLYVPMIGFALAMSDLIVSNFTFPLAEGTVKGVFVLSAAACWLASLGVLTARRNLDWRNADALLHQTVLVCPDSARVHYGLGRVYAEQSRWTDAGEEFRRALSIDPANYNAINDLGRLAQMGGDADTAIADYQKVIAIKPDWGEAYYNLGSAYVQKKQYDAGISALTQADRLKPGDAPIENNLAVAYAGKGDLARAIETLHALLAAHPEDPKAGHNLALFEKLFSSPESKK